MLTQVGGTRGDKLPFPIGEKRSIEEMPYLAALAGMEVKGQNGDEFRLVRLNVAAGLTAAAGTGGAQCSAFAYSAKASDAAVDFDVEPAVRGGAIPINRVCGFGRADQVALADNDFFWLHVDGPEMEGYLGEVTTDVAVGEYLDLDDDADLGKLYGTDTTFSPEFTVGTSLETQTGNDAKIRFRPCKKFRG